MPAHADEPAADPVPQQATIATSASAAIRTCLHLFSGPSPRADGLSAFLLSYGIECFDVDVLSKRTIAPWTSATPPRGSSTSPRAQSLRRGTGHGLLYGRATQVQLELWSARPPG